jgi:2-polyprenyl-6-methoxyphenol hydroxylase-like FAD-dependent oxidoreductase
MAAYWMARCGINARIIDKRSTKVFVGHADGLRPRTLELFDSMGFQHRVLHEASSSTEINIWVRKFNVYFSVKRQALNDDTMNNRAQAAKEISSDNRFGI